eukprot:768269-Hanusia_phi.AAC.7
MENSGATYDCCRCGKAVQAEDEKEAERLEGLCHECRGDVVGRCDHCDQCVFAHEPGDVELHWHQCPVFLRLLKSMSEAREKRDEEHGMIRQYTVISACYRCGSVEEETELIEDLCHECYAAVIGYCDYHNKHLFSYEDVQRHEMHVHCIPEKCIFCEEQFHSNKEMLGMSLRDRFLRRKRESDIQYFCSIQCQLDYKMGPIAICRGCGCKFWVELGYNQGEDRPRFCSRSCDRYYD